MWTAVGLAGAWVVYDCGSFLMYSPQMALLHPEQVNISGNHFLDRASVLEIFKADRNKSVLRIPLERRRAEIGEIPWVEHAVVRRVLPNEIQVEITERTPVAFLRQGTEMALIDAHGVILDRPLEANFHFPVVTGIDANMPAADREQRMQLFSGFTQQIESARPGAMDQISEVDLTDASDLRATITGLDSYPGAGSPTSGLEAPQPGSPVLVHFGDGDFATKYETLIGNIHQWRATAGHVVSVDLRFGGEAVVNSDTTAASAAPPKQAAARSARRRG